MAPKGAQQTVKKPTKRPRAKEPGPPPVQSAERPRLHWTNNTFVAAVAAGIIVAIFTAALGVLGWAWVRFDSRISTLETDMAKVKQDLADGGGHALAALLQKSQSQQQIVAGMNLTRAQVQVNIAKGTTSNPQFMRAVTPAITKVAQQFPNLPETWQTVSTVANYRTASLDITKKSTSLPDCDSQHEQLQLLYRQDYPQFKIPREMVNVQAYLFRNCTLHLSRLPGHSRPTQVTLPDGPYANHSMLAHIGVPAYAENCVIVLDDQGISDTDILWLEAHNCRFEFDVNRVPPKREQMFLLAALQDDHADGERLPLDGRVAHI